MNEVDKLFAELPSEDKPIADVFEAEKTGEPAEKAEVVSSEEEPRKNRRHRRLEQQLQEEREARIRLEAQLETRSELSKFSESVGKSDVPAEWLSIYGGNTDEGRQQAIRAWELQQSLLATTRAQAKEEALQEIEERNTRAVAEQRQYESLIDSELEAIEDQYNVDITSDSPAARKARREYLEVVQALSPKDEDGTITDYADFGAAWEMYQLKRGPGKSSEVSNRQKDIADRSMAQSGSVNTDKATEDAQVNYLRSIGIRI